MAFIAPTTTTYRADLWLPNLPLWRSNIGSCSPDTARGVSVIQCCSTTTQESPATSPASPSEEVPTKTGAELGSLKKNRKPSLKRNAKSSVQNSTSFSTKVLRMSKWERVMKSLELAEKEAELDPKRKGLTAYMYDACLIQMAKYKRWDQAFDILKRMRARNLEVSAVSLSNVIFAGGRAGKLQEALQVLEESTVPSGKANVNTLCVSAAMNACELVGETDKALELLEVVKATGKVPHISIYAAAISVCASTLRPEKSLELFKEMPEFDVKTFPSSSKKLISALMSSGLFKEGLELYVKATKEVSNINKSSFIAFQAASRSFKRRGNWEACVNLITEMRTAGVVPDKGCFRVAIEACGYAGKGEKALDLIAEMVKSGVKYDCSVQTAVAIAAKTVPRLASPFDIVIDMKARKTQPNGPSYSKAIKTLCNEKRFEEAFQLLDGMNKDKGVQPSTSDYNNLFYALSQARKWESFLTLLEKMRETGVQLNEKSYEQAMNAFSRVDMFEKGLALLAEMKAAGKTPTVATYNSVLELFRKDEKWESILEFVAEMRAANVKLNRDTQRIALRCLYDCGKGQIAYDFLRQIQEESTPSSANYIWTISACAKVGLADLAAELFNEMPGMNLERDSFTYGAMLRAYAYDSAGSNWDKASELLEVMRTDQIYINLRSYNDALKATVRAGKWDEVARITALIDESGLEPNTTTNLWILTGLELQEEWKKAITMFESLEESGAKLMMSMQMTTVRAYAKVGKLDKVYSLLKTMKNDELYMSYSEFEKTTSALSEQEGSEKALQLLGEITIDSEPTDDDAVEAQ